MLPSVVVMMLAQLARSCFRHKKVVLAVWLLVVIGGFAAAPVLFGRLSSQVGTVDGSESDRTDRELFQAAPHGDEIYAIADGRAVADPALRESTARVADRLTALPGVAQVSTPWNQPSGPDPRTIARDGKAIALIVRFMATPAGAMALKPAERLLHTIDAPRVVVGGDSLLDDEMDAQAASDLGRAELLSMPVVLVVLLVVFGGIIAAGLPVLIALVGVAATLGALALASYLSDVSVYAVNIVTMLGLGLAIDYALLLVSRFREERATDPEPEAALIRTFATAGRTVAFSGMTVAASLAGLLAFPDTFLRSMGLASLAVVLLDLIAAVTLLPALLALFGHRLRAVKPASAEHGFFVSLTNLVRARPLLIVLAITGVLAVAATPFLGARYSDPDARSLPKSTQNRQLADLVRTRFDDAAAANPITIVAHGSIGSAALASYVGVLQRLDGVRSVSVRDGVPGLTVVDVHPAGEAQGKQAMRLVKQVRALDAPAEVSVTGDAASLLDYQNALISRLPVAVTIMVGSTFVLLFLFSGSLVVPIKALVMNTLSLGASFGAQVWVFQDGHLGTLVGTEALGSLSITTPVLVFAIAFGLSMDYEVFLLGRISETWRATGDNNLAIAAGLQRTGRVVTAAALLMVIVFAGFVAGGFSPVKQVGLGLVLAIAIDATLVRMLLMPAVMSLMGQANWWAPRSLRRLRVSEPADAGSPMAGPARVAQTLAGRSAHRAVDPPVAR
jgi:RND superfamily putative drug exporter